MTKKEKKSMKVGSRFDRKRKKYDFRKTLKLFLEKAGIDSTPKELNKKIIRFDIILAIIASIAVIVSGIILSTPFLRIFVIVLLVLTLVLIALYMASMLSVFLYLDFKIYQRTKQVEEVLPDFLQLTSANIGAGMPIDRALWLAVRPRFGILAKEIEEIAKATIAGEDLNDALLNFSNKYNSKTLKEAINLLIAGLDSGGEIAELLNKIAVNIEETRLMQKEISANVMTYAIFIAVASILAAPFLFALSGQLLATTKSITSNIEIDQSTSTGGMFSFNFTEESITAADFNTFALLMLFITAFFSVSIISVIRKGSIKEGFKLIPIFLGVSLVIYYVAKIIFELVLGSLV